MVDGLRHYRVRGDGELSVFFSGHVTTGVAWGTNHMGYRIGAAALAAAIAIGVTAASAQQPMGATGMAQPLLSGAHDGSYLGLMAGINSNELKTEGLPSLSDTGHFGGAYIGYGITVNGTYVGVEFDAMLRDVQAGLTDGFATVTASDRWMGSARVRLGLPVGPALLYGTGGLAVQQAVLKYAEPGLEISDKEYTLGLVIGAGMDLKLTNTVTLKLEGRHYAWQDEKFSILGEEAKIGKADTLFLVGASFKLN